MEDYGFEYSDEEPEEQDVDIENQYYNSKGLLLAYSRYYQTLKIVFPVIFVEFSAGCSSLRESDHWFSLF